MKHYGELEDLDLLGVISPSEICLLATSHFG